MKRYIFLSLFALLFLGACEEEVFDPVLKVTDKPVITSPAAGASVVLTEDNAAAAFSNITWEAADFGFQAGVAYTVELDKAGNNFAAPINLGVVNALELKGLTNGKINSTLLANGVPGEVPAAMELRIAARVNPEVPVVYSDPVAMSITPFTVAIDYPKLQVPGSYQGWNPADEKTVIFSLKSDKKYEGYVYFSEVDTKYKFTDGPTWDVNYGDTGADGKLDQGGDDMAAPGGVGMYRLNADLNALTHSAVRTDWGVLGDATPTGWDSDTDLVYDADSGTLKVTLSLTAGGKIKFRANDGWDINLGDNDANRSLEYGGTDIDIAESGNYLIELILNQAVYTYKLTKN